MCARRHVLQARLLLSLLFDTWHATCCLLPLLLLSPLFLRSQL